ncbi:MAG: YihA family ribosome biogenesis GTP-binding protein [Clostridiales bacterium]|nr:YihA family ribosome biogenesis GTP-binding protein [Candidatus Coliplasma equi]
MEMSFYGVNLHNTDLKITAGLPVQLEKDGMPQIALAGRSNVGKSSLVNSLLGRKKLARVSSEPGKTITVNYYSVDDKLYLVDLPGYGFAHRAKSDIAKWASLTTKYFEDNDALRYVLLLIDIRVGFTNDDLMMLDYLDYYNLRYMIVATKCDKLNKTQLNEACKKLMDSGKLCADTEIILYSSLKDIGRDILWDRIITNANA